MLLSYDSNVESYIFVGIKSLVWILRGDKNSCNKHRAAITHVNTPETHLSFLCQATYAVSKRTNMPLDLHAQLAQVVQSAFYSGLQMLCCLLLLAAGVRAGKFLLACNCREAAPSLCDLEHGQSQIYPSPDQDHVLPTGPSIYPGFYMQSLRNLPVSLRCYVPV